MKPVHYLAAMLTIALPMLAAAPSFADPPSATACVTKVVTENEKFLVQDTVCAPGASSPMSKRPMRVLHVIKGAKMTRTFEDGSTEKVVMKSGQTNILNIDRAYSFKNESKTAFHVLAISNK